MMELLLTGLFEHAKNNDEAEFNRLFEQVFECAKKQNDFAHPTFVTKLFCDWTMHIRKSERCGKVREFIGTRNFGTNYAIMTKEDGDFDSFVIKKYKANNKTSECFDLTKGEN